MDYKASAKKVVVIPRHGGGGEKKSGVSLCASPALLELLDVVAHVVELLKRGLPPGEQDGDLSGGLAVAVAEELGGHVLGDGDVVGFDALLGDLLGDGADLEVELGGGPGRGVQLLDVLLQRGDDEEELGDLLRGLVDHAG